MNGLWLNIGSGQRPFAKPWINVDCQSKWNPDVVADAESMPMFGDDSANCIVLHHVLEHFGCNESVPMLEECHRILVPGGSLIATVPDMRALVRAWVKGTMNNQLFFTNLYGAYMGDEADRHKWGFTISTLMDTITLSAKWDKVGPFNFREIPHANIANDWWITGVEAIK